VFVEAMRHLNLIDTFTTNYPRIHFNAQPRSHKRPLLRGFPTNIVNKFIISQGVSPITDNHSDSIRCTEQSRKLFIMQLSSPSPYVLSTGSPGNLNLYSSLNTVEKQMELQFYIFSLICLFKK
jgi:hypothetical protein